MIFVSSPKTFTATSLRTPEISSLNLSSIGWLECLSACPAPVPRETFHEGAPAERGKVGTWFILTVCG